jgi:hypothetical protein
MGRRVMYARVTDEARRGLLALAEREGITITALSEAVGLALLAGTFEYPPEIVEAARRIDFERHTRT